MIHIAGGTTEYPFKAIHPDVLEYFYNSCATLHFKDKSIYSPIIRMLECFLQVTNQKLDVPTMKSSAFAEIITLYIGALYSPTFIKTSQKYKYNLVRYFLMLTSRMEEMFQAYPLPEIIIKIALTTNDVNKYVVDFEKLQLDEEKLWLWRGWSCTNRMGRVYWPPLYPIYERLGRSFTHRLHMVCLEYLSTRNDVRVPCMRALAKFIENYSDHLDENDFQCPEFMGHFWRTFYVDYFVTGYAAKEGSKINTLASVWQNHFINFVKSYLIPAGIFVEPWGEMPTCAINSIAGAKTNIRVNTNGELIKEKLLTDIPLQFTDEVAMHLLFKQIQADVDVAVEWASLEVIDIWKRYQARIELSSHGQVAISGPTGKNNGIRWLLNRENPDHLMNAATTISHYGHIDNSYTASLHLPKPLTQTAYELGLPITGSLLPHCILLVKNHPQITPSYLENFELFDKNGKLTGFMEADGTYKLIGYKRRSGSERAQQVINLNSTTALIVQQIIALTSSIREFLRLKGDDNWRYLLLTCKQGFSYPIRLKWLSNETTVPSRAEKLVSSLEKTCSLDYGQRKKYVERFSLVALRASCAVLVYLQTRSIKEMSKALGHVKLEMDLIHRYLPEPILAFFQERWIRIFQAAILVEALKESVYLVEASGFNSIHELDVFLKTHALKIPTDMNVEKNADPTNIHKKGKEEIIFGINANILTLLISLQIAVQNAKKTVHEKAKYWAELSKYLIAHLNTLETYRPDIHAHLEYAKLHAEPAKMDALIYG